MAKSKLFVDTNVFLRFLTNDDSQKAERAEALFRRAIAGDVLLETSLLVIAEIVWTLESFYQLPRERILDSVEKILYTPGITCPESSVVLEALELYVTKNVDFIDAYHAVVLRERKATQIVTFDRKHFRRFDWLEVLEP